MPHTSLSIRTGSANDVVRAAYVEKHKFYRAVECSEGDTPLVRLSRLVFAFSNVKRLLTTQQSADLDSCYHQCAEENVSAPGICFLGYFYEQGIGQIPQSATHANFFFSRCAAANNCSLGKYLLGANMETGTGIDKDPARACGLYEQVIIESGFTLAVVSLAHLLDRGAEGVPRDSWRAVELYQYAIRTGESTEAMNSLAAIYAEGRPDVTRSIWHAIHMYERSILKGGGSPAMVGLAGLLESDLVGDMRNFERAVSLYEEAIKLDENLDALIGLGTMLRNGRGAMEKDVSRAAALWQIASDKGSSRAKHILGHLLELGDENFSQDVPRAMELYDEIADQEEFKDVRCNLAWHLSSNVDGVPQNFNRAVTLYEMVIADDADTRAMHNLAYILTENECRASEENVSRAISLYETAIEDGYGPSMHNLGNLLSSDAAGPLRDMERSTRLLRDAFDGGETDAYFDLGILYARERSGDHFDLKRAIDIYETLVDEFEHMGAMINLSQILFEGIGEVRQDIEKAKALCERAIAQGYLYDAERLESFGIRVLESNAKMNDMEVVSYAVEKGWHLVAMCNLIEILLHDGGCGLGRATRLLEAAVQHSQFDLLRKTQKVEFREILTAVKKILQGPDSSVEYVAGALRIYEILAERAGDSEAMYCQAEILIEGRGEVSRDRRKALGLCRNAAARGNEKAMMKIVEYTAFGPGRGGTPLGTACEMLRDIIVGASSIELRREATVNLALLYQATHR